MKSKEILKEEFYRKFTIRNSSSTTNIWWQVPLAGQREIASPNEVWEFIEKEILSEE